MVKPQSKQKSASSANKRGRDALDLGWKKESTDQHIQSSDEESDVEAKEPLLQEEASDDSEEEAPDVKRVRLAREYLAKLDKDVNDDDSSAASEGEDEDSDDEQDYLSRKLQRERLKRQGFYERLVAERVARHVESLQKSMIQHRPALLLPSEAAKMWIDSGNIELFGGHDLTPTCVALDLAGKYAVSGSKDCSLYVWDMETKKRLYTLYAPWKKQKGKSQSSEGRNLGQIIALDISSDGRYVVVGKRDRVVSVFDLRSPKPEQVVKTFEGHKGPITALTFQSQSYQCFSASEDRCIRHYNLGDMMYMETLYGHQFPVSSIDCHRKERPISVGRDRTARAWKLAEDTHLVFRGGSKIQSADCVVLVKDDWFVTGHEDGHICLWYTGKKRAVASIQDAHGPGNGIVSISALKESDLVASGSNDGYIRLWRVELGETLSERGMSPLVSIPIRGYVNSIQIGPKARFIMAAVGQEHRLGRWNRIKGVKNRIARINLHSNSEEDNDDEENDTETEEKPQKMEQDEEESDASSTSSS